MERYMLHFSPKIPLVQEPSKASLELSCVSAKKLHKPLKQVINREAGAKKQFLSSNGASITDLKAVESNNRNAKKMIYSKGSIINRSSPQSRLSKGSTEILANQYNNGNNIGLPSNGSTMFTYKMPNDLDQAKKPSDSITSDSSHTSKTGTHSKMSINDNMPKRRATVFHRRVKFGDETKESESTSKHTITKRERSNSTVPNAPLKVQSVAFPQGRTEAYTFLDSSTLKLLGTNMNYGWLETELSEIETSKYISSNTYDPRNNNSNIFPDKLTTEQSRVSHMFDLFDEPVILQRPKINSCQEDDFALQTNIKKTQAVSEIGNLNRRLNESNTAAKNSATVSRDVQSFHTKSLESAVMEYLDSETPEDILKQESRIEEISDSCVKACANNIENSFEGETMAREKIKESLSGNFDVKTKTDGTSAESVAIAFRHIPTIQFHPAYDSILNERSICDDMKRIRSLISSWGFTKPSADSKKHNAVSTLIILDWDDTIMPTFFITLQNRCTLTDMRFPAAIRAILPQVEARAIAMIDVCRDNGSILLVTNASLEWLLRSAEKFLPRVLNYLMTHRIKIVSARDIYQTSGIAQKIWKVYVFSEQIQKFFSSQLKDVVTATLLLKNEEFYDSEDIFGSKESNQMSINGGFSSSQPGLLVTTTTPNGTATTLHKIPIVRTPGFPLHHMGPHFTKAIKKSSSDNAMNSSVANSRLNRMVSNVEEFKAKAVNTLKSIHCHNCSILSLGDGDSERSACVELCRSLNSRLNLIIKRLSDTLCDAERASTHKAAESGSKFESSVCPPTGLSNKSEAEKLLDVKEVQWHFKSIKLLANPSPVQLIEQYSILIDNLPNIFEEKKSLDIAISKKSREIGTLNKNVESSALILEKDVISLDRPQPFINFQQPFYHRYPGLNVVTSDTKLFPNVDTSEDHSDHVSALAQIASKSANSADTVDEHFTSISQEMTENSISTTKPTTRTTTEMGLNCSNFTQQMTRCEA